MSANLFASPLHSALFPTGAAGRLFSDSATLRAMLLVEGALARVQGQLGIIPETSAKAIERAAHEVQIDPGALAQATGENGVCVPALVSAFRAEMNAPEHAQYIHWGATSQDIMDTALMLRMRQWITLAEADLKDLLDHMAKMAAAHAETKMAARTYGQGAIPTTWGAVLAQWGAPLLEAAHAVAPLREGCLWVSLSGAAGTGAVWGDATPALRAGLAEALHLRNPERPWHTDRGPILRLGGWMTEVTATLTALGQSMIGLSASGIDEIGFGHAGHSSTMPQKQNPVSASAIAALGLHARALHGGLIAASAHQHQRDGSAWFAEWLTFPQLALTTTSALHHARALTEQVQPYPKTMAQNIDAGLGLIHAEALTFALARTRPRPEAQAEVKALCLQAQKTQTHLRALVSAAHPELVADLFDGPTSTGQAQQIARAFARRVEEL